MMDLLAYIPFWDPLTSVFPNFDRYWLAMVIPLVIAVCLVYKGTRVRHVNAIPRAAAIMIVQVFIVMTVAAGVIYGIYYFMTCLHG